MRSLFLNTASNYLHVALIDEKTVTDEIYEKFDRDLSKMALVRIKELLDRNNLKPNDIEEIYVVEGPGSFTGLRVGITIAKVFAWGLNKKLYAVSNLFVMATSIKNSNYIIPMIDARRGYVYAGVYDENYNPVLKDKYISLEELLEYTRSLNGTITYVTNDKFSNLEVTPYIPDLNNTWQRVKAKEVNCYSFEPEYLKKTEAEENLEHDQSNK